MGRGLWPLREPPVVERPALKDKLWSTLWPVCHRGQGRCVVLEGPPGAGRRRLRTWLSARAHELGCTITVSLELPLEGGGGRPWQDRVVEAVQEAAAHRPVVLSIEGQAAPQELRALIEELTDPTSPLPVLVLLIAAPEDPQTAALEGLPGVHRLRLEPLTPAELSEVLAPLGLPPAELERLYTLSGGLPGRALAALRG